MKMYAYVSNGVVTEIIPEFLEAFPDVPLSKRYTSKFISKLTPIPEGVEVQTGYLYNEITGTFVAPTGPDPVVPPVPIEPDIEPSELTVVKDNVNDAIERIRAVEQAMFELL